MSAARLNSLETHPPVCIRAQGARSSDPDRMLSRFYGLKAVWGCPAHTAKNDLGPPFHRAPSGPRTLFHPAGCGRFGPAIESTPPTQWPAKGLDAGAELRPFGLTPHSAACPGLFPPSDSAALPTLPIPVLAALRGFPSCRPPWVPIRSSNFLQLLPPSIVEFWLAVRPEEAFGIAVLFGEGPYVLRGGDQSRTQGPPRAKRARVIQSPTPWPSAAGPNKTPATSISANAWVNPRVPNVLRSDQCTPGKALVSPPPCPRSTTRVCCRRVVLGPMKQSFAPFSPAIQALHRHHPLRFPFGKSCFVLPLPATPLPPPPPTRPSTPPTPPPPDHTAHRTPPRSGIVGGGFLWALPSKSPSPPEVHAPLAWVTIGTFTNTSPKPRI